MTSLNNDNQLESPNLLIILFKWRKSIILVVGASIIISAAASFLITPLYKSTVVLFAAKSYSVGQQIHESANKDVFELGNEEDNERLMQLLVSDQLRNKLVDKENLWEQWKIVKGGAGSQEAMKLLFAERVNVEATKFGSVEVSVMDEDPIRAARIANEVAALADTISIQMRQERARETLRLAQLSLDSVEVDIKRLEDSLHVIQSMGIYSYHGQVIALSEMYGRAIAMGYPDRAATIKKDLDRISEYGAIYKSIDDQINIARGKETHLKKRKELFQSDAEASLPVKYVVDYAQPADKKAYPVRWFIVAVAAVSSFVFVVAFVLIWDTFKRLKAEGKLA